MSLSHAVPGLFLIFFGIQTLHGGSIEVLPIVEIAVGAAVLSAIAMELRRSERAEQEAIGWVEIAAGAMLIVEGVHARHPRDPFQPALFYFASGIVTLAAGIASARLPRPPRLEIDGDRFLVQVSRLRRTQMGWTEVASYDPSPNALALVAASGRRIRINLNGVANRAEVLEAWMKEASRRGIPRSGPVGGASRPPEAIDASAPADDPAAAAAPGAGKDREGARGSPDRLRPQ